VTIAQHSTAPATPATSAPTILPTGSARPSGLLGRAARAPRSGARLTVVSAYTALAVMVTAGLGYAAWTATGSGSGGAEARTAQALTVAAGSTTADLYPGVAGAVVFSVTNPNPYDVSVTSASITSIASVTGAGAGGCTADDFTTNTGSVSATTVPAGGTATVTLVGGLSMDLAAGDGCQGVTVTVAGTVSGTQV